MRFKRTDGVEVYIDGMGDPGADLQPVEGAEAIRGVAVVFMQTRLCMLDEIDRAPHGGGGAEGGAYGRRRRPGLRLLRIRGTGPTVTDADVVLGRVTSHLGGGMRLDAVASLRRLKSWGDPVETARQAVQLANMEMA